MDENIKTILIIDITLFASIIIFYFINKDEINPILGYRTKRSMKNIENWKFAQTFYSKNWLFSIPIMLTTQFPILLDNSLTFLIDLSFYNFVIYSVCLIIITEIKLKKFDLTNKKINEA
jgi:uncharacterized membrane protein